MNYWDIKQGFIFTAPGTARRQYKVHSISAEGVILHSTDGQIKTPLIEVGKFLKLVNQAQGKQTPATTTTTTTTTTKRKVL